MATPSRKPRNWNIYSTHYSPANSSNTSSQRTSLDHDDRTSIKSPCSEYLPYGRQRSVFPYGIVSEYDLKDARISAETNDKIHPGKLASKWSSSPCLGQSSSTARWGWKMLQTSSPGLTSVESKSTGETKERNPRFRRRMHSCPSTPVNDFLCVEVPKLSSIMVQAQPVSLVSRPLQPLVPTKLKTTPTSTGSTRRPRPASVNSFERPKKTTIDSESKGSEDKDISKTLSEIKIEDGVIFIENGKAIDLREDKLGKKHKLKHSEAVKSHSYREFQDAMQKFEDAQLNLEGKVNAKAKTFETLDKEQEFFNEHVQTQFLDLLSSVKEKRKKNKGKKYRC